MRGSGAPRPDSAGAAPGPGGGTDVPRPDGARDGTDGRVVGFVDIGTNSVRLMVVQISSRRSYRVINLQREVVRLGEEEFGDRLLRPAAIERAVTVCRSFAALARSHGAREIVAVATSATREARNQGVFVARLHDEAGLDVHVVSGREEARLIYLGIQSRVELGERTAFCLDIGGGSTEIMSATAGAICSSTACRWAPCAWPAIPACPTSRVASRPTTTSACSVPSASPRCTRWRPCDGSTSTSPTARRGRYATWQRWPLACCTTASPSATRRRAWPTCARWSSCCAASRSRSAAACPASTPTAPTSWSPAPWCSRRCSATSSCRP